MCGLAAPNDSMLWLLKWNHSNRANALNPAKIVIEVITAHFPANFSRKRSKVCWRHLNLYIFIIIKVKLFTKLHYWKGNMIYFSRLIEFLCFFLLQICIKMQFWVKFFFAIFDAVMQHIHAFVFTILSGVVFYM